MHTYNVNTIYTWCKRNRTLIRYSRTLWVLLFIVGIIEILSKLHKLFAVMEPRSKMAKLNKANKYLNNFNFKIQMVFYFFGGMGGI